MGTETQSKSAANELSGLVYELLDAHADTIRLAAEDDAIEGLRWRVHREYLRDLQRVGREMLAAHAAETQCR